MPENEKSIPEEEVNFILDNKDESERPLDEQMKAARQDEARLADISGSDLEKGERIKDQAQKITVDIIKRIPIDSPEKTRDAFLNFCRSQAEELESHKITGWENFLRRAEQGDATHLLEETELQISKEEKRLAEILNQEESGPQDNFHLDKIKEAKTKVRKRLEALGRLQQLIWDLEKKKVFKVDVNGRQKEKKKIAKDLIDYCVKQIEYYQKVDKPEEERRWLQAKVELEQGNTEEIDRTINTAIDLKKVEFDQAEKANDTSKLRELAKEMSELVECQHELELIK